MKRVVMVACVFLRVQPLCAMKLLCWKSPPCANIQEDNCLYKTAADEFEGYVRQERFDLVFAMLRYDPESCHVNIVHRSDRYAQERYRYTFWTCVLENYGLTRDGSWRSKGRLHSVQEWHAFLELLLKAGIDVNSCWVQQCDVQWHVTYQYSPFHVLFFGHRGEVFSIKKEYQERIKDALTFFREKKVVFNPQVFKKLSGGWEGKVYEYSIFYHIFEIYQRLSCGIVFPREIDDIGFLEDIIDDLVALGIDTEFLYSYEYNQSYCITAKEIYFIHDYINDSKNKRLKKVFEMACWKRGMKWPCYLYAKNLLRSYDVQFDFE